MFGSTNALKGMPIFVAWLLTVGVDVFFNAGLFSGVFEQAREPGLLPDHVLFRRIPVAYLALVVAVIAVAWLLDRMDVTGMSQGFAVGALAGVVTAFLGIVSLWTAIEMTGAFVVTGVFVQVIELGAAGAFLGAYRATVDPRRLVRRGLVLALVLAVLGVAFQNLLV